jgi:S1-C subfamily serine protease
VQVRGRGPSYSAAPLAFDPHDDIAILRVPQVTSPPLKLASDASDGTGAAILGFPQDGPFDAQPGRIGQAQDVSTEDAYGQGPVTRSVTPLRGLVRPGNSGGPMVDAGGEVVATVFAATTDSATPGGFAIPNPLVSTELEKALHGGGRAVSTGPCAG